MIMVRVNDDYNLIALQDLDTDDFDGCEFSKKFRAETSRAVLQVYSLVATPPHF